MALFRPTTLLSLLKKGGVFPKKSLSQNFLIDGNIVRKIVEASHICPEETILEIGPGSGVLTQALLEKKAHVIAVEKDSFFASQLSLWKENFPRLEIFEEDFLRFPLKEKISKKIKVVSNLPYNITSDLFLHLFAHSSSFTTLILMVQKEAAERILSLPSTKNYGALSLLAHFYTNPRRLFDIPSSCFYPKAKVQSTLLEMQMQKSLPLKLQQAFHQTVFRAFQQRRKTLTSSLKELYPQKLIQEALCALGLNEQARPEELSSLQFFQLFEYADQRGKKKTLSIDGKRSH
jgi:16S rRNA (adenine1518-N6/adenine1519-N6)-dimethyltransferase